MRKNKNKIKIHFALLIIFAGFCILAAFFSFKLLAQTFENPNCSFDAWECTDWGECDQSNLKRRTCTLVADCANSWVVKPNETRVCNKGIIIQDESEEIEEEQTEQEEITQDDVPELAEEEAPDEQEQRQAAEEKTLSPQTEIKEPNPAPSDKPAPKPIRQIQKNKPAPEKKEIKQELKILPVQEIKEDQMDIIAQAEAKKDTDRDGMSDSVDSDPFNPDVNNNGIPDAVDVEIGVSLTAPDQTETDFQKQEEEQIQQMVNRGAPQIEAEQTVKKVFKQKRAEKKIEAIREVAKKKYQKEIKENIEDSNGNGISDEVEVSLGVNPYERAEKDVVAKSEAKFYGAVPETFGKKVTTGIYNGYKFSKNGFAILAACEAGKNYTLYFTDSSQRQRFLLTKRCSDNNKIVFDAGRTDLSQIRAGRYAMQVREARNQSRISPFFYGFADVSGADAPQDEETESRPVFVEIVDDAEIAQPVVRSIENIDVAGLAQIEIFVEENKRIHVRGIADVGAVVVSTFESAIYTSAMMADASGGNFEVVSAEPLQFGEHNVVLYAMQPEKSVQSPPVKLRFSLVEAAQAASAETDLAAGTAAEEVQEQRPAPEEPADDKNLAQLFIFGGFGAAAVLIGIGIFVKKRNAGASGKA